MDRPVPQIRLKERRDVTIQSLCRHFAEDRLEITEFEERLDQAHRASTVADLDALLADLPGPADPVPAPMRDAATRGHALREAVRDSRTLFAFMGGVERRGQWTPARKNLVIAIMGGAELDFREVEMPAGETEVYIICMMGGAEIIVPPGLAVDASGIAIMGGFAHAAAPRRLEPGSAVLRINGLCIMGGVDIHVRHPGESAKEARLRERDDSRTLRERNDARTLRPRNRQRGPEE
jgi:hypothetical protein